MFRQGPISLTAHAAAEPLLAALFVAAPFLFGFSDQGAPTAVSIVVGVAILVVAMSTCWRLSLIKVIPVAAHMVIDLALAALVIASPFLFGFSDHTAPTAFFLVMGVLHLLAVLGTRWVPATGPDGGDARPRRLRRRRRDVSGSQPTR
jgi:hypothetical protein